MFFPVAMSLNILAHFTGTILICLWYTDVSWGGADRCLWRLSAALCAGLSTSGRLARLVDREGHRRTAMHARRL